MNEKSDGGILGTGRIARAFTEGLKFTKNGTLNAISSRNKLSAQKFADEWKIPYAYSSYQEMARAKL